MIYGECSIHSSNAPIATPRVTRSICPKSAYCVFRFIMTALSRLASIPLAKGRNAGSLLLAAALLIWTGAVGLGFVLLLVYKHKPQSAGATPASLPILPEIAPSSDPMTLIVFAHPHCPCTRATFRQLDRLLVSAANRAALHVVLVDVADAPQKLADSPMARSAANIAGAKLHFDDGELAKRFGVHTSGHVLLYDASGVLRFSGGLTPYRGHEGPCLAVDVLRGFLMESPQPPSDAPFQFPVYGCLLFSPKGPELCWAPNGKGA
jgi:hypothetical protein